MNRGACANTVINFTSALALQIRNRLCESDRTIPSCPSWAFKNTRQESKVTCITFFRRLCINVRKVWATTKPIPTPSRRPDMIPTAGTTHGLRVMLRAPRTQGGKCAGVKDLRMNENFNTNPSKTKPPHASPRLCPAFHAFGKKNIYNFAQLISVFFF